MSFATPYTFVALELLTAAKMNAIQANISAIWVGTTAGDLDYYTSSSAKTRLALGTTGYNLNAGASAPRWVDGTRYVEMPVNADAALVTGDGQAYFDVPPGLAGYNVTFAGAIRASGTGVPAFQIARTRSGATVDVLSTKITIDSGETSSATAATAPVINASNDDLASRDILRVDVDVSGTSTLYSVVTLGFLLP